MSTLVGIGGYKLPIDVSIPLPHPEKKKSLDVSVIGLDSSYI